MIADQMTDDCERPSVEGLGLTTVDRLGTSVTRRLQGFLLVLTAMLAVGCAAGQAFRQGDSATRAGSLDAAVAAYRRAVQSDPDNPTYAIALHRAILASSRSHLERAREFENADQLEAALGEYKLASEYDPSNRVVLAKVAALEQTIRTRGRPPGSCAGARRPPRLRRS